MITFQICHDIPIRRTVRVSTVEQIFDMSAEDNSRVLLEGRLPIDERPWAVGLIVGPSGSGKTSIAKELFPAIVSEYDWPEDESVLDGFPSHVGIDEIVDAISSVGFNSPPSWLRPFRILSTGEQFRVMVARAMCEANDLIVIDEFTSVVDRTVAKIGACSIAKAVRRTGRRFVAVSCHYDIIDWLQPDWVLDTTDMSFQWRCLRRRPDIQLTVRRVSREMWPMFKRHHYLSDSLNKSSQCFGGFANDRPIAFCAIIAFPHAYSPGWKITRIVCLPDYQGVGVASSLLDYAASVYAATGRPVYISTSHPSFIRSLSRSKNWSMCRKLGTNPPSKSDHNGMRSHNSTVRLTAGFKYIGNPDPNGYAEFMRDRAATNFLSAAQSK